MGKFELKNVNWKKVLEWTALGVTAFAAGANVFKDHEKETKFNNALKDIEELKKKAGEA